MGSGGPQERLLISPTLRDHELMSNLVYGPQAATLSD